ncbi:hypothetical protein [Sorangium sp. So ce381]|uniref:hypothetical protein n=1 Tax=unclassified Sorangium TaxID=2621164 RepID=UPI003F5BA642
MSTLCLPVACSPENPDFDPASSDATSTGTSGGGGGLPACDDGQTFCSGSCADTSSGIAHAS